MALLNHTDCSMRLSKMTINTIAEKSGLRIEVAESLYWHCLWLRTAPEDAKVQWARLLRDKDYRLGKSKKCMKSSS